MNYHSDSWIQSKVTKHLQDVIKEYPISQVFGIFYVGAANYGLDTEKSDVDTRVLIVPTLKDLVYNTKPLSKTIIRENGEHIEIRDIRLALQNFKKQNINSLEILFTRYKIINKKYQGFWDVLTNYAESICYLNPGAAIKCIQGMSTQKFRQLERMSKEREDIVKTYLYDPKELYHLLRLEEFLTRYVRRKESYEECLYSNKTTFLQDLKNNIDLPTLDEARNIAETAMNNINHICDTINPRALTNTIATYSAENVLNGIQYNIIESSLLSEILERKGVLAPKVIGKYSDLN